jgi:hypothetical protein
MMKKWIPILILLMSSCSAQWHLKKAVQKDPTILKERVITIVDTVVTPPIVVVDTISLTGTDSVVIKNDTVSITITKYQDRWIVKTKVEPMEIVREVKVEVPVVQYVERISIFWKAGMLIALLILLYIAIRLIIKTFIPEWLR